MPRITPPAHVMDAMLATLLGPMGTVVAIGPERDIGRVTLGDVTVTTLRSTEGSTRYLAALGGEVLSVLQVVSRDGRLATIANAYTVPSHRRTGLAATLLAVARSDFDSVSHSADLSEDGAAFAAATG